MNKFLFTFVVIGIILLESSEGRYVKIEGRDRFNLKRRNSEGSLANVQNKDVDTNAKALGSQDISPHSITGIGLVSAVISPLDPDTVKVLSAVLDDIDKGLNNLFGVVDNLDDLVKIYKTIFVISRK
ncbi:uncharacterized protein LOC111639852 [Centruroides sculpturatus]|uniref:uncharacterized protein LOC111639852 n=1 Tax=Centruroides sculpturatus TaxID=218467 RepID=UPI000C6D69D6|nr:uncharacterized protein LOC111639852 [Centruroides sculpturatus]